MLSIGSIIAESLGWDWGICISGVKFEYLRFADDEVILDEYNISLKLS